MLNSYETTIILTPILAEDAAKNRLKSFINFIKDNGGEIVHEDNWGLKSLAYPIRKKTTGIYTIFEYKAPSDLVANLELIFKRDEDVLRFLTIRLDKYSLKYNDDKRNGLIGRKKVKEVEEEETTNS